MAKSKVKIKVDAGTKWRAEHILQGLGLPLETAVVVFLRQVIFCGGLPFRIACYDKGYLEEIEEMAEEYLYQQMVPDEDED